MGTQVVPYLIFLEILFLQLSALALCFLCGTTAPPRAVLLLGRGTTTDRAVVKIYYRSSGGTTGPTLTHTLTLSFLWIFS